MANKIVLVGAGGHAKVIIDCLGKQAFGFVDDKVKEFFGLERLEDKQFEAGQFAAIIGFGGVNEGQLKRRHEIFTKYKSKGIKFVSAVHASAIISENSQISAGCMIGPGVIINSGAVIGENSIINSGAIIEHDAVIGAGTHVAPGAIVLGGATVGETCMIGAGAVILQSAKVADNSLVKSATRFPA